MQRVLIISGMHRSGTSLVAALATQSGIDMGERLLPAGPGNPRGHFEDLEILEFHEAALAARGGTALTVPPGFNFAPTESEEIAARRLLDTRLKKSAWGFKDPRATLFLQFWADRIEGARFVLLYRHPAEVLLSLLRRGADLEVMADPASALRCWEIYSERVLAFRRDNPQRCELWDVRALSEGLATACNRLESLIGLPPHTVDHTLFHSGELHLGLAAPEIDWEAAFPAAMALYRELDAAADWRGSGHGRTAPVEPLEAAVEHLLAASLRREFPAAPLPPHLRRWYSNLKRVVTEREVQVSELQRRLRELDLESVRLSATRSWQLLNGWWRFSSALRARASRARRRLGQVSRRVSARGLLIGCVSENSPAHVAKTLRLVHSIRWFGGEAATARILVCFIGDVDPAVRISLEALGAEVRGVPRLDARSPFANKLQFFAATEEFAARHLLLLDCDTLVVDDPLLLLRAGVFSAVIADVPSVTHDVFVRLFAHYGLRLPARRHLTTLLPESTIPYFNSGVISLPAALARDLVTVWRRYNQLLLDEPALLTPCELHANQAALSLALVEGSFPYRVASPALNLPIHMPHLARTAGFLAIEPVILHYHDRVAGDGTLQRTGYPLVDARIDAFNERWRAVKPQLPAETPRLVVVHHRLAGRTGHRFQEAQGLIHEAQVRGLEPVLLIHREAEPEVLAALPSARPTLHDPVFDQTLSFADRVCDFAEMLHSQVDHELIGHDLVLMTVATQCEAAAFAEWMHVLGEPGPRVVLYFHSDRWNRSGGEEYRRQLAEFQQAAATLAGLPPECAARLRMGAATTSLAAELSGLLGQFVSVAPLPMVYGGLTVAPGADGPSATPRIGFLGGARSEKGSHKTRAILEALRGQIRFRALLQLANEQMADDEWAVLEALAEQPDVEPLRGGVSVGQWQAALASCDLLVLPYDRISYRQRASGIFAEGVAAGVPSVVPDGIWMAEQITNGVAAGVSFSGNDPGAVAAACADAVSRLPELRTQAAQLAAPWRRATSLTAFLDWAEST